MRRTISLVALTLALVGCQQATIDDENITVGASSTPHALILEAAREDIESRGYKLEIKVMTDYVTPNIALDEGEIDANYFQHKPHMDAYNDHKGTEALVSAGAIHFEPMGIYKGAKQNNKILVPNDVSNYDRAMKLLKQNGYTGEIVEMEAQMIPLMLEDCELACINGNYALSSHVLDKVIVTETNSSEVANRNANIIAVRKGDEDKETTKVLLECLRTEKIRNYIEETFGKAVIPMF